MLNVPKKVIGLSVLVIDCFRGIVNNESLENMRCKGET